jgi:hypothetical protein
VKSGFVSHLAENLQIVSISVVDTKFRIGFNADQELYLNAYPCPVSQTRCGSRSGSCSDFVDFTKFEFYKKNIVNVSVADPGCLSRIPDPDFYPSRIPDPGSRISDPGSRIQKQQQKREVKKN